MPVEFPSLRLPTVALPSAAQVRAKFTAFTDKVSSAVKSLVHRSSEPARSLQSRTVSAATGPLQAPLSQLKAAVLQRDQDTQRASLDAEIAKLDAELEKVNTQLEHLEEAKAFRERLAAMKHHVPADEMQHTSGLGHASVKVLQGANRDQQSLAPAELKPATQKPAVLSEPRLATIGPAIAKWNHAEVFQLSRKLADNLARLNTLEIRLAEPDSGRPAIHLGGPGNGPKSEIADIEAENAAIAKKLGTLVGQAFKHSSAADQKALALGSGGELKQEFWKLLQHAAPNLPDWHYGGVESDFEGEAKDLSAAKKLLDQVYSAASTQLDTHLGPGNPPSLHHKGETFEQVKELGRGAQGVAYLYASATGKQVVVKAMANTGPVDATDVVNARTEFGTHHALMGADGQGHPNVLNQDAIGRTELGLPVAVLELASGGDAKDFISKTLPNAVKEGLISPEAAHLVRLSLLRDSIEGMVYLQEQLGARHADFKPGNLFISGDGNVKVADFGLTNFKAPEPMNRDNTQGTTVYMAPEQFIPGSTVDAKADTWSVGVFAHELFLGDRPFDAAWSAEMGNLLQQYADGNAEGARNVVTKLAENHDQASPVQGVTSLDRLLNAMLHPDANQRPSLSAILNSSLFDDLGRGVHDRSGEVKQLIQALNTSPADPAQIKALSASLGV